MSKAQNLCNTKGCNNKKVLGRNFCNTCRKKKYRVDNPVKSSYQTLRYNAKRRGKEFNITFEEFEKFCIKTEYIIGKGKSKDSYAIDRIDDEKGYTVDNIRVITTSDNSKKEINRRKTLKFISQGEFKFTEDKKDFNRDDIPF